MAKKVNLSTEDAVKQIKNLVTELKTLKKTIAQTSKTGGQSFNALNANIKALAAQMKGMDAKFKSLNSSLARNTQVVHTNSQAIRRNTTSQNKNANAQSKSTKATKQSAAVTRKSTDAYTQLTNEVKKAERELKNLAIIFGKNSAEAQRARVRYQDLKAKLNEVNATTRKSKDAFTRLSQQLERSKRKVQNLTITQGKNSRATRRATREYRKLEKQMRRTEIASRKTRGAFGGLLRGVRNLMGAFGAVAGVVLFANLLRSTFKLIKTFDSLNFTMKAISKNSFELAQNSIFLNQLVSKFGVTLIETANRWIKFSAAARNSGLTLKQTQDIFRSMTKTSAVLGLRTDELRGIYLALEQMLSKGKITTEELRRQLGERLPGAMGIMAKSMGISIEKLDKMMKKGEVLSADVLPRFANAVEIAFGVDKIETVSNLQSAVGRLEGSWQLFVDRVINSDSQVSSVLQGWLDTASSVIRAITLATAPSKEFVKFHVAEKQDLFRLEQDKKALLEIEEKYGQTLHDIKVKVADASIALRSASNKEEKEEAQKHFDELFKLQLDFMDDVTVARREEAKKVLADNEEYAKALRNYLFPDDAQELESGVSVSGTMLDRSIAGDDEVTIDDITKTYDEWLERLADVESKVNDAKLALEKGLPPLFPEDDETPDKKLNEYQEYVDGKNKLDIANLKRTIANNEAIIASENNTVAERIALEWENAQMREDIAEKTLADEITAIDLREERLKKAAKDKLWVEGHLEKELEKIRKQAETDRELAEIAHNATMDELKRKRSANLIKLGQDDQAVETQALVNGLNERIATLNQWLKDNPSAEPEARDKVKDEIAAIEKEKTDTIIKELIRLKEAEIASGLFSGTALQKKINELAELKAALSGGSGGGDQESAEFLENWIEEWGERMKDLYKDIYDELGELADAFFDRKIEKIEAEIQAETEKYDTLLKLAGDDAAEREIIERNKDLRLKELERKRLKEEQKQARVRKAFAIGDIAIQTATALVRAKASSQLLPPGVSDGYYLKEALLIALLGALQTATVLAQPIPQYEKGGKVLKDEIAQINERRQEFVERDGKILTTTQRNAIVGLQKGDVVHPDFDSLRRKSILVNGLAGGEGITKEEFNKMFDGIEGAIEKGFRKAKINNRVSVLNQYDAYKQERTTWN